MFKPTYAVAALLCSTGATGSVYPPVLAECGASTGKARWVDENAQWTDDGISGGSFTFTLDAKGSANVLFRDVSGRAKDAVAGGAEILLTHATPGFREFGLLVVYGTEVGLTETFNVVVGPGGSRQLLWTSNRSGASGVPKVSAFTAPCR